MKTSKTVLSVSQARLFLLNGHFLETNFILTIHFILFPTQIFWNSIALHIPCMFLIPLVMTFLFVFRKASLLILKSITLIILGRHVSIHLNHMPICRFAHAFRDHKHKKNIARRNKVIIGFP